ncbi:MAG: Asp-tRNA(Asn)/Glu-tRNA(Gln) amidotransferase subunit GatC [Candidatus Sericytochromatia bacterium]
MAISQQQVEHIARLARLALEPEELARVGEQMGRILEYVEQLNELDTEGIEPASHALPLCNVLRPDRVVHRLSPEEIFQNAPDLEDAFFRVPQIMSEEP